MPSENKHDIVDELSKLLLDIMMLGNPPHVPARFASVDSLQTLYANIISLRDFLYAASNGDLSRQVSFKGYIGGALKTLQANLRHITWQTTMVASGDFTQRVEFMGEFSQSFNAMVMQLDQTLNELVRKDTELRKVNDDLLKEIDDHKLTEEALKQSEVFSNTLINSIPIPIFYKDRDGRYTGFNKAYENFFGATKEKLIGKTVFDISPPELAKIYHAKDNELLESGVEQHYEAQVKNTLGVTRDVIFSKAVFTDSKGTVKGLIGAILDLTERKHAEERLKHLANHDLLTDLPSLRLAKDRLSVALNMARRYKKAVAMMFIDLDGFKDVNDTLGHDAGDYVLKQVAQRMLSCVRETDTVTRVGGDEFLIIATEINAPESVAQIAEKVIHLISQPIIFNGRQAVVSASIGIALFPDDGKDMDQLIKKADEAMYRVKNAGKNGFCFVNTTAN
jgi:diguanylate cyclase (GGDEF)-like protein/PAS domain S-box-containing protein